jgi:hypothetical protein
VPTAELISIRLGRRPLQTARRLPPRADPSTGQMIAMLRVEDALLACAWTRDGGLAAGGVRGLYLLGFNPRSPQARAQPVPDRQIPPARPRTARLPTRRLDSAGPGQEHAR